MLLLHPKAGRKLFTHSSKGLDTLFGFLILKEKIDKTSVEVLTLEWLGSKIYAQFLGSIALFIYHLQKNIDFKQAIYTNKYLYSNTIQSKDKEKGETKKRINFKEGPSSDKVLNF